MTMVREPAQRLYSEFLHLRGGISCHGAAWRLYQPALCNGSVLLPGQRRVGEPARQRDEYYAWPKPHRRFDAACNDSIGARCSAAFEAWLAVGTNCGHNRQARQLAPMGCAERLARSAAYSAAGGGELPQMAALAKETLRERAIFGLTERFGDSVALINKQLAALLRGGPLAGLRLGEPQFGKLRERARANANASYPISPPARALVARLSAADVELYAFARQRFDSLLASAAASGREKGGLQVQLSTHDVIV
jgi:hypothetical protein